MIGSAMHVKKAADALIFTNGKNLGGLKRGEKFEELSDETLDGAMRDSVFEMRLNDQIYEYEETLDQEEPGHTPTTQTHVQADLSFPGPQTDEGQSNQAPSSSSASSLCASSIQASTSANSLGQMSASAQVTSNASSSSGQSKLRAAAAFSVGGGQMSASAAPVLRTQQEVVTPCQPSLARSANAGMSEDEALATAMAASLVTSSSQEQETCQADQDDPGQCHLCGGDYYYQVTINFSTFKIFILMYQVTDYDHGACGG